MSEWLYTLRGRFTAATRERFDDYRSFSGFRHITEVVTLDSMICRDLIDELQDDDWEHNVHEDFRIQLFRDSAYLMSRQPLNGSKHQLIAAMECPPIDFTIPNGFVICGFDIMDSSFGNSALTNCGRILEAFQPDEVNNFGLIDDRERAFAIRDTMRGLNPNDPHLGECEVWLIARRIPSDG